MKQSSKLAVLPLLVAGALAQFVPAPTDLITKEGYAGINVRYKEVPAGICELDPNVKSYSGYADVEDDQHIFWWFFETRNGDPKDAPLTVWINGGPGSSSMIGLFQELGPCGIGPDLKPFNNPYSWSNVSNMLFIDEPTTVGMSYSIPIPAYQDDSGFTIQLPNNTCPDYAQSYGTCGTTLQAFYGAFPQYSRESFSFTTESYGGHYGPIFNSYILDQNAKNISGAATINLKNVLIGNGWFDPLVQYQGYYQYAVDPGNTYDYDPYNASVKAEWYNNLYGEGNCVDQTKHCYVTGQNSICSRADDFCASKVENMYDIHSGRDEYDMRYLTPDPFPYDYFVDYLNKPEVQQAIGAYQNFSTSSRTVSSAFGNTGDDDRESGTIEACQKLLDAGVQVMLYYGDADYNCNWMGGLSVADEINAEGYNDAGFTNITTSDNIVHGQVKQSSLFSFLRIYESGHEVPFYQPLASLEIFHRALKQLDIASGKEKITRAYKTAGTPTSTYREGNATVQFDVTASNATYNTMLNAPDPEPTWPVPSEKTMKRAVQRRQTKKLGKPRMARRGESRTYGVV
ncbi:carboxypeptidase S1 [Ampelomyces quisqualis]|uniref:Carboxypeptidase S1 n=1 Tax=Ampelomyces quisqualis TaxID=50730 RepID=A0A6A5Q8J6_AMPQU|nr:carboxypeptidase S1 [Ampelomyces quisqualis]